MSIERIKKDCKYIDHPICQYAGSEGCADCILNMANAKDAADIASGWEVTQSNLPDDIDALHTSTACQFCREGAREKVAYALIEMAHPEPEYMKKKFFGLGQETRAQVGSLLQIPVPICAHCKKLLQRANNTKWFGALVGGLLAMLILSFFPDFVNAEGSWYVSMLSIAAGALAGYAIGMTMEKNIRAKLEKEVILDIKEIPQIAEMIEKGWYQFGVKEKKSGVLVFTKKKPRPNAFYKNKTVE